MTNRDPSPYAILFTAWLGLVMGVIIVMSSTFSVLFGSISTEFGWSRSRLSLAYSLFSLTSTLALPLIGRLVDQLGAKTVVVACASSFAVLTLLLRFADSLWSFFALFVLIGIISGGTSTLPYFKVLVGSFVKRRGFALGIANSGTAVGTFLFPLIAQRLNASIGWRDTYVAMGCVVAVVTIPVVLWCWRGRTGWTQPGGADDDSTAPTANRDGHTLAQAMQTPQFWVIGVAFFTATTALVGYLIHVVPLLKDRGMTAETAALAASVFGAAQLLGRVATGFLLDRLSGAVVAASLWIIAAAAFALLWTGISGMPLLACTALAGLAFGGEGDVLAFLVSRLFGSDSFGRIYSVLLMINLLGGVAGPYLFGAVFDATGGYTVILGTAAITTAIAAALILYVRNHAVAVRRPHKKVGWES